MSRRFECLGVSFSRFGLKPRRDGKDGSIECSSLEHANKSGVLIDDEWLSEAPVR